MRYITKNKSELNNSIILELFADNSKNVRTNNMSINNLYIVNNDYICSLVNYTTVIGEYYKKHDTFLISIKKYSATTGKIQSKLKNFLDYKKTIYCYNVNATVEENITNYIYDINVVFKKLYSARVTKNIHVNNIIRLLYNFKKYLDFTKLGNNHINDYKTLNNYILELKRYWDKNISFLSNTHDTFNMFNEILKELKC